MPTEQKNKNMSFSCKKAKEKNWLYKICKPDKLLIKWYKEKLKEFEKVVKIFNIQHKESSYKNPNIKKFYSFIKSKLSPSFPALIDENNIPIVCYLDKVSFFNKYFQKVISKDYEDKHFKLIGKNCPELNIFL